MVAINAETATAPATLSWASIVKGGESGAPAEEPAGAAVAERAALSPGPRGSRACECRGQVLMMLAYYGWIAPLQDIDHPDADKHEGHVYVRTADVAGGAQLAPGQIVSFYLYADDQGLGAEDCRPEGAGGAAEFCFRATAPDFVPAAGTRHVPPASADADADSDLSSDAWGDEDGRPEDAGGAAEFRFRATAPDFVPAAGTRRVPPASAQKAQDAADADTDLSSDAGGDSEDLASDSEDSLCGLRGGWPQRRPRDDLRAAAAPPLCGRGSATAGAHQAINLDDYEEHSEPGAEACWEVIAMPPPAAPEDGGLGSAPWRSHGAPPGLERGTPGWRLACLDDGASWPRDLPWRRC